MHLLAETPEDAVRQCLGYQRDPHSATTVFRVTNEETGQTGLVDVESDTELNWLVEYEPPCSETFDTKGYVEFK
jgi:hypothetical protein